MFVDAGAEDVVVEAFPERVVVVLAEPVRSVTVSLVLEWVVVVDVVLLSVKTEPVLSEKDAKPSVSCVFWEV